MIISLPVHLAVWVGPARGASLVFMGVQLSEAGLYFPPNTDRKVPLQTIISVPVQTIEEPSTIPGASLVFSGAQVSVAGLYRPPTLGNSVANGESTLMFQKITSLPVQSAEPPAAGSVGAPFVLMDVHAFVVPGDTKREMAVLVVGSFTYSESAAGDGHALATQRSARTSKQTARGDRCLMLIRCLPLALLFLTANIKKTLVGQDESPQGRANDYDFAPARAREPTVIVIGALSCGATRVPPPR